MLLLLGAALLPTPLSAAQSSGGAQPVAAKEKMICKRETPIGSLIATRKRCMTKSQWDRLSEDQQYEAEKFVERNRGLIAGQ